MATSTVWTSGRIAIEVLGWLGAISLLTGYFLIQTQKVKHDDLSYMLLNIIGALFLTINTFYHRAYPSVVTNLIWMLLGSFIALKMLFFDKKGSTEGFVEFRQ